MKSNRSLVNKALFKYIIKRYYFIMILEILYFIYVNVMFKFEIAIMNNYNSIDLESSRFFDYRFLFGVFTFTDLIPILLIPSILGLLTFRFMYKDNQVSMIHSLPLKRKTIFITNYVASFVMITIPVVISNTFISVNLLGNDVMSIRVFGIMLLNTFFVVGVGMLFYSISVFVGMLVGSTIMQVSLLVYIWFVSQIIVDAIDHLLNLMVNGYSVIRFERQFQYVVFEWYDQVMDYIMRDQISNGNYAFEIHHKYIPVILLVMLCVISFGAYGLYLSRKMESHNKNIAFSWIKYVLIIIVLVPLILILGFGLIKNLNKAAYYVSVIIVTVLGIPMLNIVCDRMMSFKEQLKYIVITISVAFILLITMDIDLIGYEKRQPDLSDVTEISISILDSNAYGSSTISELDWYPLRYPFSVLTNLNDELIQKIYDVQTELIENKPDGKYLIRIEYLLKNGKSIKREYKQVDEKESLENLFYSSNFKENLVQINFDIFEALLDGNNSNFLSDDNNRLVYLSESGDEVLLSKENLTKFEETYIIDFDNFSQEDMKTASKIGEIQVRSIEDKFFVGVPLYDNFTNTLELIYN